MNSYIHYTSSDLKKMALPSHLKGKSNEFKMVCLERAVLETNLAMISRYTGETFKFENTNYCFSVYKQYISWIYGRLGKHIRQVILSCVVWAIRKKYPSDDGEYVPFNYAEEQAEET